MACLASLDDDRDVHAPTRLQPMKPGVWHGTCGGFNTIGLPLNLVGHHVGCHNRHTRYALRTAIGCWFLDQSTRHWLATLGHHSYMGFVMGNKIRCCCHCESRLADVVLVLKVVLHGREGCVCLHVWHIERQPYASTAATYEDQPLVPS